MSLYPSLASSAPLCRPGLNAPDSWKIKQLLKTHAVGFPIASTRYSLLLFAKQGIAIPSRQQPPLKCPDILMAAWAGTWKCPGHFAAGRKRLESVSTTPGGFPRPPPIPAAAAGAARTGSGGPGADTPPRDAPRAAAAGRGRAGRHRAAAGSSGLWGWWEKKHIYRPASPRSFATRGSSSSPHSGRATGGGC